MISSSVGRSGGRVLGAAVVMSGLLVGIGAGGVAAQDAEQLEPTGAFEFVETGVVSPLAPGIAEQQIFAYGSEAVLGTSEGYAVLSVEGDQFETTMISHEGVVTTNVVTASSAVDLQVRTLQFTDDYVLAEGIDFEPFVSVDQISVFRFDRTTGQLVSTPATDDRSGAARLSDDGRVVSGNSIDPYWGEFSDATEGNAAVTLASGTPFSIEDFEARQLVPVLSRDGSVAVIVGVNSAGAQPVPQLWVKDTAGGEDQFVDLSCPAAECDYEVHALNNRNGERSAFVTTYATSSDNSVAVDSSEVFFADGRAEPSIPVSEVSSNGRYVIGQARNTDALDLTDNSFVVRDLETGRERTFDNNYPDIYIVEILDISDDGLTIRHSAADVCPLAFACVEQPAYFGHIELSPVADMTAGPAADQVLRLYRAVFGRIPDGAGFEFWMDRYREGEPLVDIAAQFAASDEFATRFGTDSSDEELVDALYRNTLGRAGDEGGLAFWLDRRAGDLSISELLIAFSDSPENIERTGTRAPITVPEGRVLRVYRAILGREPDASGLAFWVGEYNDGMTLAEMARLFTGQLEYTALYGEDPAGVELVDAVYRNVLRRPGDVGGIAFWLDGLNSGLTVPELFVSFADSPENVELTGTVR